MSKFLFKMVKWELKIIRKDSPTQVVHNLSCCWVRSFLKGSVKQCSVVVMVTVITTSSPALWKAPSSIVLSVPQVYKLFLFYFTNLNDPLLRTTTINKSEVFFYIFSSNRKVWKRTHVRHTHTQTFAVCATVLLCQKSRWYVSVSVCVCARAWLCNSHRQRLYKHPLKSPSASPSFESNVLCEICTQDSVPACLHDCQTGRKCMKQPLEPVASSAPSRSSVTRHVG